MEDFRSSLDSFSLIPSFESIISLYKSVAEEMPESKLTEKQHRLARLYNFKDWQSFQYEIKKLHTELSNIDLNQKEWGFIFDSINGSIITMDDYNLDLDARIVDSDIYDSLGSKWFDVISIGSDDGGYKPSEPMMLFIQKVRSMSDTQKKAILLKALAFWERTFDLSPRISDQEV